MLCVVVGKQQEAADDAGDLARNGFERHGKITKRAIFLTEMDQVVLGRSCAR